MDAQAIRDTQEALRLLSFYDPRLIPVTVDGIYSSQTTDAVRIFQTLNGLDPTGEVDRATWEELFDSVADTQADQPLRVDVFPHRDYRISPGEQSLVVTVVQHILQELSDVYENIRYVEVTGIYDRQTADEVRHIQSLHRLEPNGILDAPTWNVIATLFQTRSATAKR